MSSWHWTRFDPLGCNLYSDRGDQRLGGSYFLLLRFK